MTGRANDGDVNYDQRDDPTEDLSAAERLAGALGRGIAGRRHASHGSAPRAVLGERRRAVLVHAGSASTPARSRAGNRLAPRDARYLVRKAAVIVFGSPGDRRVHG